MKMRLGFAINVNIEPDILVIDEALSVGDATFKKKCKNKIADIIKSGVTVLYVSHSAESVRELCTRAIYMKKGELIYDGPVDDALKVYQEDKAKKAKK
jgi:teichoic acid transport system ATP-binding protein